MRFFNRFKLWQIALTGGFTFAGLTMLLLHWAAVNNELEYHKRSLERSFSEIIDVLSAGSMEAMISEDIPLLQSIVDRSITPELASVMIRNEDGNILASRKNKTHIEFPFSITRNVRLESELFGSVEIVFDLSNTNQSVHQHVLQLEWLLFGLIVSGGLLLVLAIRQLMLRPIEKLHQQISYLAEGNYTKAFQLHGSRELTQLSQHINQLGKILENKHIMEQNFRRELQKEVDKRTDELQNLYEQVKHQSQHDPLTGLANRTLFFEQLEKSILKQQHRMAMLFIDLDNFKDINDRLGHDLGDTFLKEVSARLSNATRREDTIARFGGDEFLVLLSRITSISDAVTVAEKVISTLNAPCPIGDNLVTTSASIGISLYPDDADNAIDLFKKADQAMYMSKQAGKGGYTVFKEIQYNRSKNGD
ncbi:MAG: diguanylate cyclase [Gammaproteobacteria bacterium]|nr:diguanylate cyclase [Gammaproteobacteria bacterium]